MENLNSYSHEEIYDRWQWASEVTPLDSRPKEPTDNIAVVSYPCEGYVRVEFFDLDNPNEGILFTYTCTTHIGKGLIEQLKYMVDYIEHEDF